MSSDVQSALAVLQLNDYISLIIATAVTYDYCLTFSKEVAYIWNRPWTRVSTLFLLIRYVGYLTALTAAFGGSTFIPGLMKSKIGYTQGTAIEAISRWSYVIFWVGADMAMILRVYAIYDRSRIILGALLVMYITQVVIFVIGASIYSDSKYSTVLIVQLLDFSVCGLVVSTQAWNIAAATIQCILASVLCILVVVKFARDSVQMYQATRTWQLNRYISLLTRDGLLYFLATLFTSLVNEIFVSQGNDIQGLGLLLPSVFADVLLFNLTPRFVINVRELYVLDLQGRWDGDIDTGFGLSSRAEHGVGRSTTIGTIAFVNGGVASQSEDVEESVTDEERVEGRNGRVLVV